LILVVETGGNGMVGVVYLGDEIRDGELQFVGPQLRGLIRGNQTVAQS